MSHETIYLTLFIQARGGLKRELTKHLRTRRANRRPKGARPPSGKGKIVDPVMISERPAAVEDRAVPGHWEGDLLCGSGSSQILTLEEFARRQIEATIKRDFNHPSIVVWSTGNEVWIEEEREGISPERVEMMADMVRELDPSRPVTQALHVQDSVDGKNYAALDLTGWNYGRRYMNYRKQYPDRPIIYSESASTFSTRGYYDPELPFWVIFR